MRRSVKVFASNDLLVRSIASSGEVAVMVMDATHLVREAATRHKTAPTATAALGRVLMGTLLLASFRKEDEVMQVTFRGDGPIGSVMAIADTRGNVKGKVDNVQADPPLRENGKLNVGEAVGQGILAVVRSHPRQPNPMTGMVPITTGEIAEDLATYLADSEQTNSALALGVMLDRSCEVKHAGGYYIQVLPFCSEDTLMQLEKNLSSMKSVTEMLEGNMSLGDITEAILSGIGASSESITLEPEYGPCEVSALRERMMRAVALLGKDEVKAIAEQEGKIEVTCDFCRETLQFKEDEVLAAIQ